MGSGQGLKSAREYPLWDAIFGRRSRRVAAGTSFRSGTFSFQSKLEPAARRPTSFYRGYDVVDRVNVGFISSGPEAQRAGTLFDVTLAGNGNRGHEYGTGLSPAEKRALLEFMKTL